MKQMDALKPAYRIVPVRPTESQRVAGMTELPIEMTLYTAPVYTAMILEPCGYPIDSLLQRLTEMANAHDVPGPYQALALELVDMLQPGIVINQLG